MATTRSWVQNGTTLTYQIDGKTVATLSGVSEGITVSDGQITDGSISVNSSGVIELTKDALGKSNVTLKGSGYKLALASNVHSVSIKEDTVDLDFSEATAKTPKIYVKAVLTDGYELTSTTKITYTAAKTKAVQTTNKETNETTTSYEPVPQVLATISGIQKAETEDAAEELVTLDKTNKKVILSRDVLTTAAKTATTITSSNGGEYNLALATTSGNDEDNDGKIGFEKSDEYWSVSKGTATYKQDTEEGWTLADDGSKVTYTAKVTGATIATIKGLNTATTIDKTDADNPDNTKIGTVDSNDEFVTGIEVAKTDTAAYKFELNQNVLNTTKGTVTVTPGKNYTATLELDREVPKTVVNGNVWTFSKGTGTYKNVNKVYYTLDDTGTKVTCTPQTAGTTLATIKGLATDVDPEDVIVSDDTGVITLKAGALPNTTADVTKNSSITLTLPKNATKTYTLALDNTTDNEIPKLEFGEPKAEAVFNAKGTTTGVVNIMATVTGGYITAADGKSVIYRATTAKDENNNPLPETIATISGLVKSGLKANDDDVSAVIEAVIEAVEVSEGIDDNGNITVTLKKDALGTSNVTVKATGSGVSYKLALDTDEGTEEDPGDPVPTVAEEKILWEVNGTTATYKKVNSAYYTYDATKNQVVYNKPVDIEVYAVVKNIKSESELNVSSDGSYLYADDEDTAVVSIDSKKKLITVAEGALDGKTVSFDTKKTGADYKLALKDPEGSAPKPDGETSWTVSKGTATLKGKIKAGYVVADDGKSINYKSAANSATLATLTNINASVYNGDLGYKDSEETFHEGVSVKNSVVTIKTDNVLTTKNSVFSSNYGYTIELSEKEEDDITTENDLIENRTNSWTFDRSTGTATYGRYNPAYYKLNGNTIEYFGANMAKTLAKVTGLNPNLVVGPTDEYPSSLGVYINEKDPDNKKTSKVFHPYVTLDETATDGSKGTIKLTPEALNKKDVDVTGDGNYTLAKEESKDTKNLTIVEPNTDAISFSFDGTTATLKKFTSEGYKLSKNGKTLEYTVPTTGSIVAEVTGLKSGLKVGSGTATDESGNSYTEYWLGFEKERNVHVVDAEGNDTGKTKKEKYITKSVYMGTVTNNLSAKGGGELEDQPAIFLTADALSNNKVTFHSNKGNYQLNLVEMDEDGNGDKDIKGGKITPGDSDVEYKTAWKVSGSTAELIPYESARWEEKSAAATLSGKKVTDAVNEITYTAAKPGATIAKVTGLAPKKLIVDAYGQIAGLTVTSDANTSTDAADDDSEDNVTTYTITVGNSLLNKTDVTVEGRDDNTYKLKLDEAEDSTDRVTAIANKTTTVSDYNSSKHSVVYTETIDKTGYRVENGSIVYMVKNTDKTTITGVSEVFDAEERFKDGVFTLSKKDIYNSSDDDDNPKFSSVTLTTSGKNNSGYKLALDEEAQKFDSTYSFSKAKNAAKATYVRTDAGLEVASNGKSITAYNDKKTTVATISGLKKDVTIADDGRIQTTETTTGGENNDPVTTTTYSDGITATTDADGATVLTLDKAVLGANNVTLSTKANCSLAINAANCAPDTVTPFLTKTKGTATIREGTTEGWTLKDAKTITYSKANYKTLATISGLPTTKESEIPDSAFDATNHVITLDYDQLNGSGSKITLKDGTSSAYSLALSNTKDVVPTTYTTPQWNYTAKTGKALLQNGTTGGWTLTNNKTITKVAAKLTNVATVTGLPKDLVWDKDNGVLYLNDENESDVTAAAAEDTETVDYSTYTKALTFTPAEYNSNGTVTKNGVITITKQLLKAGSDALVTKGTGKNKTVEKSGVKKLTLSAKDNYTFAFAEDTDQAPDEPKEENVEDRTLKATANGTFEYSTTLSDGWALSSDNKTVSYVAEGKKTLAKITGLNTTVFKKNTEGAENLRVIEKDAVNTEEEIAEAALVIDDEAKTIMLTANALAASYKNGAKISITSDDYKLAIDSTISTPATAGTPKWTVKGTTAVLNQVVAAGFTLSEDGKTLTYSAETTEKTLATVTGLKKGLKVVDGEISGLPVFPNSKTIAVSKDALGTGVVKINDDSEYTFDTTDLNTPYYTDRLWTVSKGTATLNQNIQAGYTLSSDGRTLTYTADNAKSTLITVSGLNTGYSYADDPDAIEFNESKGTVVLKAAALGTKKVTLKNGKGVTATYSLEMGDDVQKAAETVTEWVTSGTTATYKTYDKAWYNKNLNTGAIEYNAESKPTATYATISGLKKGATIDTFDENTKVVTLKAAQVGTSNITIKDGKDGSGYTLALAGSVDRAEKIIDAKDYSETGDDNSKHNYGWTNKNGTATLYGTMTAGFTLSANGKTATYSKEKFNQTFAKVTGLKSGENYVPTADEDNVITLDYDQLNGKNVTLTNSNGSDYTLKLDSGITASKVVTDDSDAEDGVTWEESDVPTWTISKTNATLKGVVSEGYKLTSDTTIVYTAATATKTKNEVTSYVPQKLAVISGLANGTDEIDAPSGTTIELRASQLNANKVSVDGTSYYDFEFASDYNNASIIGSANADSLTVEGTGLSISGGKGNDYIELGNHGNTILYASGEGNDVIVDFDSQKDKIAVTKGSATLTKDGSDMVLKVGSGSLTLKDTSFDSMLIYDSKGAYKIVNASSADLLESDNFLTADSDLGAITGDDYKLGDFNATQELTSSDYTELTKQSSLVSFGKNDK